MTDQFAKKAEAWSARFSEPVSDLVKRYTASVFFDKRLALFDIQGSLAHAEMLAAQGIISAEDRAEIERGMAQIRGEIEAGQFEWLLDLEDVHLNIEKRLTELVGDAGKRLHTGRSRNDQVATDIRLYMRAAIDDILALLKGLRGALTDLAERNADTIMPGFTHLQVREARHDRVRVAFRQVGQGAAQAFQQGEDVVDGGAHVQADVGRHLVVARAARVQALAGVADQFRQAFFDVQVHVFQVEQPLELAGFDLAADLGHAALDFGAVLGTDDALGGQHFGVGERTLDVEQGQALVEEDGRGVALDEVGDGFGEAGRPGFRFFGKLISHDGRR